MIIIYLHQHGWPHRLRARSVESRAMNVPRTSAWQKIDNNCIALIRMKLLAHYRNRFVPISWCLFRSSLAMSAANELLAMAKTEQLQPCQLPIINRLQFRCLNSVLTNGSYIARSPFPLFRIRFVKRNILCVFELTNDGLRQFVMI